MKVSKKEGFSLSEILITLVIVGIVAVLTITNLIHKVERVQWETGFKKGYARLKTAEKLFIAEQGNFYPNGVANWEIPNITPYLKMTKCTTTACTNQKCGDSSKDYRNYVGQKGIWRNSGNCYYMDDGAALYLNTWLYETALIFYDYNGRKGPNRLGYDLFVFHFATNNQIVPYPGTGASECSATTNKTSNKNGRACGVYALKNPDYFKNLP